MVSSATGHATSTASRTAVPSKGFLDNVHALRALAVSLVLVYHAYPNALPGGYVGVDVFFVISGFLITGIVLRSAERTGRVGLADFYVKRARRILPAATSVIIAVVLIGLLTLPSIHWRSLGEQAVAAAQFRENWYLAGAAVDYLAEGTSPSPLQHYWSLSVEEQYYLVWPFLFAALVAVAIRQQWQIRRTLGLALAAATAISLALMLHAGGSPESYFQTHTRVWELAAGGLLACTRGVADPHWSGGRSRALLAPAGLAAVIAASLFLNDATQFPGPATLLPVVGALMVIAGGPGSLQKAPIRRIYRSAVTTWLGNISYSLYLWHWPILVFLALWGGSTVLSLPWQDAALAVVLSLGLATVWRRHVELLALGARLSRWASRAPRSMLAAAVALVLVGSGLGVVAEMRAGHASNEAQDVAAKLLADPPEGFGAGSIWATDYDAFVDTEGLIVPDPGRARAELPEGAEGRCKSDMGSLTTPTCEFGDTGSSTIVALVGDSHAEQYLPAFQAIADERGWRLVTYFHSSCPFAYSQRISDQRRGGPCLAANEKTLDSLSELQPDIVVTSSRTAVPFVEDGSVPDAATGFVEMWNDLKDRGLPLLVIPDNPLMLPEDGTNGCVARNMTAPQKCERSRLDALPVDRQLEAAAIDPTVNLLDLSRFYCTDSVCPPVIGSVLVYRDEQHLTPAYVRTLAPAIGLALERALAEAQA